MSWKGQVSYTDLHLFSYIKGMWLAAAPCYYPTTEFLFQKLIPKSVPDGQLCHTEYTNRKIICRLDLKTDPPNFMTPFMKNNLDYKNMSHDKILSSFNFIIVGGSETTAIILTGIFNHLLTNESIWKHLNIDICSEFEKKYIYITISAIKGLPYLKAVINAGLHIYNSIPGSLPRIFPEGGDTYVGVYLSEGVSFSLFFCWLYVLFIYKQKSRIQPSNMSDEAGYLNLCSQLFK